MSNAFRHQETPTDPRLTLNFAANYLVIVVIFLKHYCLIAYLGPLSDILLKVFHDTYLNIPSKRQSVHIVLAY